MFEMVFEMELAWELAELPEIPMKNLLLRLSVGMRRHAVERGSQIRRVTLQNAMFRQFEKVKKRS
jgi:hypothetical protein